MRFICLLVIAVAYSPTFALAQSVDSTNTDTINQAPARPAQPPALLSFNVGLSSIAGTTSNFLAGWESGIGIKGGGWLLLEPIQLEGGLELHSFSGRLMEIPDFSSIHVHVGAGYMLRFSETTVLHLGGRVGNFRMSFDEDTFAGVRRESELTFTPYVRGWFAISTSVSLHAELAYARVLTAERFGLGFFTLGVSYALAAPDWALAFLQ